ncbi:hypothetical protein GCE86_02390 [Micromonospora terminaliae]|uniref:DUF3995 domain-containing protein n=1 Tax=Micromonospora terminaliae TaxID=1914461 RepID=A0AAJ2ZDQ1_9ACTN|nr:hypothetical protein [Micromonospora terminaliae]NES28257.1 hypothetical protein [Micromonospora terminaliae]QGL46003.1 hypothetical protein GCE86_02390 [Micromonospora terminaliae]
MTSDTASRTVHAGARRPAPAWAVRVAHLIPLAVLPSGLWRIALVAGLPIGASAYGAPVDPGLGESVYIVSLSLVSEGLALLALGLVRPWGEVFPGWLPLVGGRRVPPRFAVTTAITGAAALTLIWGYAAWGVTANGNDLGFTRPGFTLLLACYAPLLLWGPLLLTLALSYHRRRVSRGGGGRRGGSGCGRPCR